MFSLQNCTLQSEDRGNGSYWVAFEEKSFSKGQEFKVYNGRMNGHGPKSGDKCVVKVFRQCKGTKSLCSCEVKKSSTAKMLAAEFNHAAAHRKINIRITTVYWAYMDEVSKLKLLFFSGERKLSTREAVLFEDDVRVNEERPNKPRKLTLFMDSCGKNQSCIAKDLEAFAHFTYHITNGELIVCGLEGVQDEDGFFLKTPTIHSRKREFGNKDGGEQGIRRVFNNHVCNEFCCDMLKPTVTDAEVSVRDDDDNVSVGECSTASLSFNNPQLPGDEVKAPQGVDAMPGDMSDEQKSLLPQTSSSVNDPSLTSQGSHASETMESRCAYLEPSAPLLEEEDKAEFGLDPPPYSDPSMAAWVLGEPASCSRKFSYDNQMSVESGASIKAANYLRNDDTSIKFSEPSDVEGRDLATQSPTRCMYNSEDESCDKANDVHNDRKHVCFSLSTHSSSMASPPQSTPCSPEDSPPNAPMCHANGGARPVLLNRRLSSPCPCCTHQPCISSHVSQHPAPPHPFLRRCVTGGELPQHSYLPSQHEVSQRQDVPDRPPSYYDSQIATAQWIIQRGYFTCPHPHADCASRNVAPPCSQACHCDHQLGTTCQCQHSVTRSL